MQPRPRRVRLWWWMAVVALIGAVLGVAVEAIRLRRLSRLYQSRAQVHAEAGRGATLRAAIESKNLAFWERLAVERRIKADAGEPRPDPDESWEEAATRSRDQADWFAREIDTFTKRAAYHETMRRKWSHASTYPWTSVEPDSRSP